MEADGHTRKLRLLGEAGRAMNSILDPDELLERILALVEEVFRLDNCAILLFDPATGTLRIRKSRGYPDDVVRGFAGRPGAGISGWVFKEGQPVLVSDVRKDPRYIPGVTGGVSEMAVPLKLDGGVIGVLDAESRDANAFNETDLELFAVFGAQAATAIHNARLYDQLILRKAELEQNVGELALLGGVGRALGTITDLDKVLREILRAAQQALHFAECAVLLRNGTDYLSVRAAIGYRDEVLRDLKIRLGEGITGGVALTGKPRLVADVTLEQGYIPGVKGGRSEMAVALIARDEVIGVLDAESPRVDAFSDHDLEIFQTFASQAAVAIVNAQLHEEARRHKQDLERKLSELDMLNKVGRAVSSILDLDKLLAEILAMARDALHFSECAVLLLNRETGELSVKAAIGYRPEVLDSVRIKLGAGVTGRVALTGKPVLVADVTEEEGYIPGVSGGRSEMAVPLVARDQVIGVLDAESPAENAFSLHDLELFATFAAQTAVAVQNAALYQEVERKNGILRANIEEMEKLNADLREYSARIADANSKLEKRVNELATLYEAGKTITTSGLDLDETLMTIVEMTQTIVKSSASAIKLLDEESSEMRVRAVFDPHTGRLVKPAYGVVPDIGKAEDYKSFLGVPIKVGDKTIGVFEFGSDSVDAFSEEELRMLRTLATQAAVAIENARLFERTQRTYYETISGLAQALEARDAYTRGHSERVTAYATAIGREMGLSDEDMQIIGIAGMLHDIGKIGIADAILRKPTSLTAEDRKAIESHPAFGDNILGPIKFLENAQHIVLHHHERYDGAGYPDKLKGDEIPLMARIIAVADSFDAMTSDRPYRKAYARPDAIREITTKSGTQFDPDVVQAFLKVIERL
ncbi:MAG: GAF domain-containing protein [Deltaproteobacteria bacterium]|nr:GAF domain-containing protein [Deltaproteobacteria bacterium]